MQLKAIALVSVVVSKYYSASPDQDASLGKYWCLLIPVSTLTLLFYVREVLVAVSAILCGHEPRHLRKWFHIGGPLRLYVFIFVNPAVFYSLIS